MSQNLKIWAYILSCTAEHSHCWCGWAE